MQVEGEGSPRWRLCVAGLLCLRLVDAWYKEGINVVEPEAVSARATRGAIGQLGDSEPIKAILLGILNTMQASGTPAIDGPGPRLFGYAQLLERRGDFRLAADAFESLVIHGDEARNGDLVNDAWLRLAYCLRESGLLDDAEASYLAAGKMAKWRKDRNRSLLARIGLANVSRARGDLPGADAQFERVLAACRSIGARQIEARALQDQAIVAHARRDFGRAACLANDALELAESDLQKERIIGNVGAYLIAAGRLDAARDALTVQERKATIEQTRASARINLLLLSARTGDRAGFDHWRALLTNAPISAEQRVDFLIECGRGLLIFSQHDSGMELLAEAAEQARATGMNRSMFEAEGLMEGCATLPETTNDREPASPSVVRVERAMRELVGALGSP